MTRLKLSFVSLLLALVGASVQASPQTTDVRKNRAAGWDAEAASRSLVGNWVVDLRGSPTDVPYTQPFVVASVDVAARTIKGQFYGSDISWSRINTAWGKVVITLITSDGQGEYTHTATLEGDMLVGTSSAKHRNLLVPWTARREARRQTDQQR